MESMLGPAVNVALTVAAACACWPWLLDAVEVSRTVVSEMPPNNDVRAEQDFISLAREAENEIIIYDDGDGHEGSLYASQAVVDLLRAKLENPEFTLECVLNYPTGETRFERELRAFPNARIRERRGNKSRVHYKIVDGRKAYVSCHERGEEARNRRMIDCTNAMSRHPGQRPLALRRYFDDFESHA